MGLKVSFMDLCSSVCVCVCLYVKVGMTHNVCLLSVFVIIVWVCLCVCACVLCVSVCVGSAGEGGSFTRPSASMSTVCTCEKVQVCTHSSKYVFKWESSAR